MDWYHILTQKTFWIYYLRLFQNFDGDRVVACCDFFGVRRFDLEESILHDLYQIHRYDEEVAFPMLILPTNLGATLVIEFQNIGGDEQARLTHLRGPQPRVCLAAGVGATHRIPNF